MSNIVYQTACAEDGVAAVVSRVDGRAANQYLVRLLDTDDNEFYGFVWFNDQAAAIAYADRCMAGTGSAEVIL